MLVMAGYPIHLDHRLIQRQFKIFRTEEGLLDWINEVGQFSTFLEAEMVGKTQLERKRGDFPITQGLVVHSHWASPTQRPITIP